MKDNNMNNNYLASWLNKEITDNELKLLVGDAEFEAFNKINLSLEKFEAPQFDSSKLLTKIKSKTGKQKTKVISLIPSWAYAAAASVVLLLSVYTMYFTDSKFRTNFGEQTAFNLVDGSSVVLNSKSTLSYNERTWDKNRIVNLTGEAYFEVKHGNTFTVKTQVGDVKVLGTHFNVKSAKKYFFVTCFEGKVKITLNNGSTTILTKGQVYQFAKDIESKWDVNVPKPAWLSGVNSYKDTPLFVILNDLESQFNIKIDDSSNLEKNRLLTVSYDVNNLDLALKTIFVPLNYNYKMLDGNILSLSKIQ